MTPFSVWERLNVALDESKGSVDEALRRLTAPALPLDDDI